MGRKKSQNFQSPTPSSPNSTQSGIPLNGSMRVLNDLIVSIYNTTLEFNDAIFKGLDILRIIQAHLKTNEDLVQENCQHFIDIITQFETVKSKLFKYKNRIFSLAELDIKPSVPFRTWTYAKFGIEVEELYCSYEREIEIKLELAKNLDKLTLSESTFDFCIIAWAHSIYIYPQYFLNLILEECNLVNPNVNSNA